jgi:hypothetical protein
MFCTFDKVGTAYHQRSPKKPISQWLTEVVLVFGRNYVKSYALLLEVRLGQFSSENAALCLLSGPAVGTIS